jgi:L-ascorbate metabolism protein UlaG (beta-lactamase superfamily)
MESLKNTDIIFIPVGGVFTINHVEAVNLIKKIRPKIAIPIHFRERDTKVGVDTIDSFKLLASKDMKFREFNKEFEIDSNTLPKETEIWAVYSS